MKDKSAILIPDGVAITHRIAGFSPRVSAAVLDLLVVFALVTLVSFATSYIQMVLPDSRTLTAFLNFFLPVAGMFAYFILLEAFWNGRTLGKRVFGLRTTMRDGTPIRPAAAIYRNLLRPADFFPVAFLSAFISMFITKDSQRIGDLVADTIVIHEPEFEFRFVPAPHRYGIHFMEEHVGSLRGMTLDDYVVLKRLCDRFPNLPPDAQKTLLDEIWFPFAKRMRIIESPAHHPLYQMEAVVMKFGRMKQLL